MYYKVTAEMKLEYVIEAENEEEAIDYAVNLYNQSQSDDPELLDWVAEPVKEL